MSEKGDHLDLGNDLSRKGPPWGMILTVATVVGLAVMAFWVSREKNNESSRKEILGVMDKELTSDEDAIKAERERVTELTKRVEELRSRIQMGDYKNGKAAVAEFNKLAAAQRTERQKFTQMADAYNKKVAKYRRLDR